MREAGEIGGRLRFTAGHLRVEDRRRESRHRTRESGRPYVVRRDSRCVDRLSVGRATIGDTSVAGVDAYIDAVRRQRRGKSDERRDCDAFGNRIGDGGIGRVGRPARRILLTRHAVDRPRNRRQPSRGGVRRADCPVSTKRDVEP
ncbi:hypothetical protein KDW36_08155 [Burkholderia dolosa]|uniref:hypothetical protein n=1 Tax=Burkholderia dolosa TaxID=152500 RepID=UPI001B9776E6|nr:hypothetical protein [Burkholderia dolosa]MBR8313171.1 hypothetical protein [Burkholderia dolosa]